MTHAGPERDAVERHFARSIPALPRPAALAGRHRGRGPLPGPELLRRAALTAADESSATAADSGAGAAASLRVTDAHLGAALDELLDTRNQLTRVLLGASGKDGEDGTAARGRTP